MTSAATLTSLPPRTTSYSSSSMTSASSKRTTTTRTRSLSGSPKSKQRRTRPSLAVRPVHILPDLEEEDEEQLIGSGPSSPSPIKSSSSYLDMRASVEKTVTEKEEISMKNSKRASRTRSIGLNGLKDLAQGVEMLLGEHASRATGASTRNSPMSENIDRPQQKSERRDKVLSLSSPISDDEDGNSTNAFSTLLTIGGLSLVFPSPPSSTSSSFPSPLSSSSSFSPATFTPAHMLSTPSAIALQKKNDLDLEQMFNPRASSPTLSMLSQASTTSYSSSSTSVSASPAPSTPHMSDASEDDDNVDVAIVENKDRNVLSNSQITALPEPELIDLSRYTKRNVNVNNMAARKRPVPLVAPLVIAKRAVADNSVTISTSTVNSNSTSTTISRPTTLTRTNTTASVRSARRYVERDSVKEVFAPLDRVPDEMCRFDLESVWEKIVRREEGEVMRIEKEKQMVRSFTAIVEEDEGFEAQWIDVIDDYMVSRDDDNDENVDDDDDAIEFYQNDLGSHLKILQGAMTSSSPRGSFSKSYKKSRRSSTTSMASAISSAASLSSSTTSSSSRSVLSAQVPRTPRTPKTPKTPFTPLTPHSVSSLRRHKSLGHRHAANAAATAAAARRRKRAWLHERERERRATMRRRSSGFGGSDVLPPVPAIPTGAVLRDIKLNRPPPRTEIPCDIFDDGDEDLGEVYEQFDDPFAAYNVQEVVYQPKQIIDTLEATTIIPRRPRRELPDVPIPVSPLTPVTPATPAREEELPRPVNVPRKIYSDPHPKKLGASTRMRTNACDTPNPPVPPIPPMPSPQVMANMIRRKQQILNDADTASFDESRVLRSRWSSSTLSTLADNANGEKSSMLSGLTKGKFSWFGEKKDDKTSAAGGKTSGKGTKKQKPVLPPVMVNSREKTEYASFFEPLNTATSLSLKRTSSVKAPVSPKMYTTHHHAHSHSQSGVLNKSGITYFKPSQHTQSQVRRHDASRLPTTPSPHSLSSSPTSSSSSPATPSPSHTPPPSPPLFSSSGKTIRRSLSRSSSTASEFSLSSAGSTESSGRRRKPIPVEIFMRA